MASYEGISNLLDFAVAFNPSTAFPLDARSMFGSYTAAQAAAATAENAGSSNTKYYFGMPLVVFENDVATMYVIQGNKTLKEVGSAPIPDNATIELSTGGALQLKDWGKQYYKFHENDIIIEGDWTYPDTMPTEDVTEGSYCQADTAEAADVLKWYIYQESAWTLHEGDEPHATDWYELTQGWKAGLEPKVVSTEGASNYAIAWYEPSSTTVEGIGNIVSSLQTEVDNLTERVGALESGLDVKVDGTTITKGGDGTLSVGNIAQTQVTGLATAISDAVSGAETNAKSYADTNFVKKTDIVADGQMAASVDAASDSKVVSEKLVANAMTWKVGM